MLPMTVLKVDSLKLPGYARPMISAPVCSTSLECLSLSLAFADTRIGLARGTETCSKASPLCLVQCPLDFADRQSGQILVDLTDRPILDHLVQLRSENS